MNDNLIKDFNDFLESNNLRYIGNDDKLNWKSKVNLECIKCGEKFTITMKQLLRPHPERTGLVCPKCDDERRFILKMKEKYGRIPYEFKTSFTGYDNKITVKCKDCGLEWETTAKSLLMNSKLPEGAHPCRGCTKNRRNSNKDISELVKELENRFGECNYEFKNPSEYAGMFSKEKMHITCKFCGHEMETYLVNILSPKNGKHYCRVCNNKERQLDKMSYKERCLKTTEGKIEPLEEYKGAKVRIKHKCNICGYGSNGEWLKIPVANSKRNSGCPMCTNKNTSSNAEADLVKFLKTCGITNIETKNRTALKSKKEIDIYLPDQKIGFEIDGLYWHSEEHKGKKYHIDKTMECSDEKIRLVHIFEDEWYQHREICYSKVRSIIGKNNANRIYARKCTIDTNVKSSEKNEFLMKTHIQGKDGASVILGLRYQGELVAIMTFTKPRLCMGQKNKDTSKVRYELSRFATSRPVTGGFSKLLTYFKDNYDVDEILTYADIRWSDLNSNVYVKNGFTKVSISKPNYWYFNKNESSMTVKRLHRFNFRKQELATKFPAQYNASLTEHQIMDKTQYRRIWDCGNLVFEWKRQ